MVKFLIALHVLVAIASIGPLIHGVTTAARAVRANDGPAATATVRLIRVYSIASVLAVVLGMGLVSMDSPYGNHEKLGSFGQTWIWLSVLLWLAAIGLAHAVHRAGPAPDRRRCPGRRRGGHKGAGRRHPRRPAAQRHRVPDDLPAGALTGRARRDRRPGRDPRAAPQRAASAPVAGPSAAR